MPAAQKVSPQQIVDALLDWRGNVSAAASSLGISANALRMRLHGLNLSPDKFRSLGGKVGTTITSFDSVPSIKPPTNSRPKNAGANYPSGKRGRSLKGMEAATEIPIKSATRKPLPLRMKPAQREQLVDAVFDLQNTYRVATDENLILEQFFEERFGDWLKSKLKGRK